jgi:Fructose-2,6-bisphosphatase
MSLNLAGCSSTVNAATTESSAGAGEAAAGEQTISLYFVRHGKTILNTLNRVQGWSDSPLTEAGADVAKDTAQGLADISFDLVYASDRMRAMETARIIMDAGHAGTAQQINSMEGLRECNYGKYEGDFNDVMWSDIMAELGVDNMGALMQLEESTKQIYDTVAKLDETGEAESYDEVAGRLMASVEEIVAQAQASGAKNVLVVGHGGAIGVILSKLNGASVGELGNASVSLAEYTDGNYQVISVGDMSYCENGAKLRKSQPETAEEVLKPVEGEETGEVVVYLTRHGKTVFNTMGRTQGWVDSPLTAAGVEVAENLGKGISDVTFAAAYSSDMGRAVETSQIVLGLNKTSADLPLIQMPGLRETNYGKFEGGINTDMLNAALNEMGLSGMEDLNALENGIAAVTDTIHRLDETGEAEDYNTMSARTFGAFDRICKETAVNGGGNVLVVAHGNAIMSILNTIGDANALEIENASVSMIRYSNGTYTIESVNDTSYSEAGALK